MSEEKINPPRAQIFRYFRIESRNNKRGWKWIIFVNLPLLGLSELLEKPCALEGFISESDNYN